MTEDDLPSNELSMSFGPYKLRVLQASGASNILGAYRLFHDLYDKAQALVDEMNDTERNHGGLLRPLTMRARDELALELSRWKN